MNEINYWDRFLVTGKVDDFLSYKKAQQDVKSSMAESDTKEDKSGGHSHAGVYRDYGNGFKG